MQRLYRPPGLNRDVQVGDTLAKGTVIAELDEGDLRRAKASAEAQRGAARSARRDGEGQPGDRDAQLRAVRQLVPAPVSKVARDDADAKRVTAAGELATAEHALADARVQLDQANDNYVNRQLIVPFDHATVAEKHIEPGERKAAHEVAFRLIDISTVHVNFGVPDTMIGKPALETSAVQRVFLGQKLPVTADAFEGRTLTATVTKIAPEADAQDADVPDAVDAHQRGGRAGPAAAAAGNDRLRPRRRAARPQGDAAADGGDSPGRVSR